MEPNDPPQHPKFRAPTNILKAGRQVAAMPCHDIVRNS
jgi:hypothetical protein